MKKKIMFFDLAGIDFPGGCEKYFANLAKHMSMKYEVLASTSREYRKIMDIVYFVVTRRNINSLQLVKRDIGNTDLIDIRFISLIPFTQEHRTLKSILQKQEIIYAKNEFQELAYLYYMLGRIEYQKRVIVGVHTPIFVPDTVKTLWKVLHDIEYHSSMYRNFLNYARLIHVNNSDYINLIHKSYGVNKEKIQHVPNPIDWETRPPRKNENKKFTMVWFGRFTQQKGLDRLENIVGELSKKSWFNEIEIIIGGSGELESIVKRLAESYSNIHFLGFVQNVEREYKRSDISLFTAYYDTFAHAVLEPLSYGVPVISWNIPGPRDMIKDSVNGFLVNSENEFVHAIEVHYKKRLLSQSNYLKYKEKIYTETNNNFDSIEIFSKLEKLFF